MKIMKYMLAVLSHFCTGCSRERHYHNKFIASVGSLHQFPVLAEVRASMETPSDLILVTINIT